MKGRAVDCGTLRSLNQTVVSRKVPIASATTVVHAKFAGAVGIERTVRINTAAAGSNADPMTIA